MELERLMDNLRQTGILPVICLENQAETDTLLRAIEDTPVNTVEITLRHPFAPEAIARIRRLRPMLRIGAGTVLTADALEQVASAGVDFCVSPGLHEALLSQAEARGIPFLPGCATPSDIQRAAFLGIRTVKFFPAECVGGTKALKLYQGAFREISFLPTGGITMENLADYLRCSNVIACGGSFMVPREMLKAGDSESIHEAILRCMEVRKAVSE